jgi:hypothetical protein
VVPDASPPPANQAIITSRIKAEVFRQITPTVNATPRPKDAAEDRAVVPTARRAGVSTAEGGGPRVWQVSKSRSGRKRQINDVRGDSAYPLVLTELMRRSNGLIASSSLQLVNLVLIYLL